ncbi:hypothetical protein F4814DRAFT_264974 [Daldinia grandis]|nr:hypothetical protein F4814DRAFT_264974 [Daldinia grandis]
MSAYLSVRLSVYLSASRTVARAGLLGDRQRSTPTKSISSFNGIDNIIVVTEPSRLLTFFAVGARRHVSKRWRKRCRSAIDKTKNEDVFVLVYVLPCLQVSLAVPPLPPLAQLSPS